MKRQLSLKTKAKSEKRSTTSSSLSSHIIKIDNDKPKIVTIGDENNNNTNIKIFDTLPDDIKTILKNHILDGTKALDISVMIRFYSTCTKYWNKWLKRHESITEHIIDNNHDLFFKTFNFDCMKRIQMVKCYRLSLKLLHAIVETDGELYDADNGILFLSKSQGTCELIDFNQFCHDNVDIDLNEINMIVLNALCNVNAYIDFTMNANLVFIDDEVEEERKRFHFAPYEKLNWDLCPVLVPKGSHGLWSVDGASFM